MSDFFAMDGYGWFLWPSYLVTFLALIVNVYTARSAHAAARRDAERRLQMDEGEKS